MYLQDLPGAILRLILNDENSWCAIELWKCGNRTLNARLANKGVTNVSLCAHFTTSTSRWPRCLSFFKLEHLSIVHPNDALSTPAMLRSELMKLSDTLITLKIEADNLIEAIFPTPSSPRQVPPSEDFDATQPPSKRPKSIENDDSNRVHTMAWDLDTTWPRLERLELKDLSSHELSPSTFSLLPRSLTCFVCNSSITKPTDDFGQLPAGLQTLNLRIESIGPVAMLTLPKSLTDVCDSLNRDAAALWTDNPSILPLLQSFKWGTHPTPAPALFADSLTEITFSRLVTGPPPSQLPSKLTSLRIQNCTFSTRQIATFPHTLERLVVRRVDWNGMKPNDFPPHLREFESDSMLGFVYSCFSLLPRTLTAVRGQATLPRVAFATELQELKVIGRQCLALDQERWSFAQTQLYKSGARREPYIVRVEDGQLFGLPLGLTTLSWNTRDTLQNFMLPPLVKSYNIRAMATSDPEALDFVPPSEAFCADIEELTVPFFLQQYTGSVIPHETSLYLSEITRLELYDVFPNVESQKVLFRCLPPTLILLALRDSTTVSVDDLQQLPASLTCFKLEMCRLDAEADKWLGLLPRKLATLHLPRGTHPRRLASSTAAKSHRFRRHFRRLRHTL